MGETIEFNDEIAAAAKATGKPYKLKTGVPGLQFYVNISGTKVWRINIQIKNQRRSIIFGGFPEYNFAQAKLLVEFARELLLAGQSAETMQGAIKQLSSEHISMPARDMKTGRYEVPAPEPDKNREVEKIDGVEGLTTAEIIQLADTLKLEAKMKTLKERLAMAK